MTMALLDLKIKDLKDSSNAGLDNIPPIFEKNCWLGIRQPILDLHNFPFSSRTFDNGKQLT